LIQNDSRNNILDERRERRGDTRFANENAISQDIYIYMSKPTLHYHPRKLERENNARQRGKVNAYFLQNFLTMARVESWKEESSFEI